MKLNWKLSCNKKNKKKWEADIFPPFYAHVRWDRWKSGVELLSGGIYTSTNKPVYYAKSHSNPEEIKQEIEYEFHTWEKQLRDLIGNKEDQDEYNF